MKYLTYFRKIGIVKILEFRFDRQRDEHKTSSFFAIFIDPDGRQSLLKGQPFVQNPDPDFSKGLTFRSPFYAKVLNLSRSALAVYLNSDKYQISYVFIYI